MLNMYWWKEKKKKGGKELVAVLMDTLAASFKSGVPKPKCKKGSPCPCVIRGSEKNFRSPGVDGPLHLQSEAQVAGDVGISLVNHGFSPFIL